MYFCIYKFDLGFFLCFRFGGPVWWNTPLEEDGTGQDENRTTWQQRRDEEEKAAGVSKKRGFVDDLAADAEDEMPEAVRQRLDALKKGTSTKKLD